MILQQIHDRLEMLYCTQELKDAISIGTWYTIEGDPINFHFIQEDDKYARLTTNRNFSEWMANCTGSWIQAAPVIAQLAGIYGVRWDPADGCLFIRFRRNEMTLSQAVLLMQQAVFVVGSLGPV